VSSKEQQGANNKKQQGTKTNMAQKQEQQDMRVTRTRE
jgi:hypothetical protein